MPERKVVQHRAREDEEVPDDVVKIFVPYKGRDAKCVGKAAADKQPQGLGLHGGSQVAKDRRESGSPAHAKVEYQRDVLDP